MARIKIADVMFAKVYPLYIQKAERKGRTKDEVDRIVCWLTGYDMVGLRSQIDAQSTFQTFFDDAPRMNPAADRITGVICGVRVEEIEDPLMRKVRCLDKMVDELAKGKSMEKILRE